MWSIGDVKISTLDEKREEIKPRLWLQISYFCFTVAASTSYLPVLLTLLCKFPIFHPPTDRLADWPSDGNIYVRSRGASRVLSATPPSRIDLSDHVILWSDRRGRRGIRLSSAAANGWRGDFWETHQAFKYIRIRSSSSSIGFSVCVSEYFAPRALACTEQICCFLIWFLFPVQQRLILRLRPLPPPAPPCFQSCKNVPTCTHSDRLRLLRAI